MEVKKHETGATVIPTGDVNLTNAEEFKQTLLSLYEKGYKHITVDFRHLKMIDGAGLGKLLVLQKKLRESGGGLKIVNVYNDYILKMFELIKLFKVIDIEGLPNPQNN